MRIAELNLAAIRCHHLNDLLDQADGHAEHLIALIGPSADIDLENGTVTMPLRVLVDLLQPEDSMVPSPPAGFAWQVLPAELAAPADAVVTLPLNSEGYSFARPTGPAVLYLVPAQAV